jgi:hypothetical protein
MRIGLAVLGVLALAGGAINLPFRAGGLDRLERFLEGVRTEPPIVGAATAPAPGVRATGYASAVVRMDLRMSSSLFRRLDQCASPMRQRPERRTLGPRVPARSGPTKGDDDDNDDCSS